MNVTVSSLKNGLRIATDSTGSVETVTLGLWVNVGTRFEHNEINGISHMLEHMAFKGTLTKTARQIAEEIENVGGYINAYTSREVTAYYVKVLKEDFKLALELLADIFLNSTFEKKELKREKEVIIQEIYQNYDSPDEILYDYFQTTAFPKQPLGLPILGSKEIVRNTSRQTIIDFMKNSYTASRIVLAASGNIDHSKLHKEAEKLFENIETGNEIPMASASYKGGDFRENRELEQVHILTGFKGVSYDDDDYYLASALATVLGGGMSSRLFQEIRERRGLAYSTHAFSSSYKDTGIFGVYAGTSEQEAPELIPVMCEEIIKTTQDITAKETNRVCTQLKAAFMMSLESTSSRCEQIARQMIIFNRVIPLEELLGRLEAITPDEIKRTAGKIFTGEPTFTAVGPVEELESFDNIRQMLAR